MEFSFHLSPYSPALLDQTAEALERRTEIVSRKAFPRLWAMTDWLDTGARPRRSLSSARKTYRGVMGVVLTMMGLFLAVSGLLAPRELGHLTAVGGVGLFLGLWSLHSILPPRRNRQFIRSARTLLAPLRSPRTAEVRFTEEGMCLPDVPPVPYAAFDCALETRDLYLLTWQDHVTLLQKRDLQGSPWAFQDFLSKKLLDTWD